MKQMKQKEQQKGKAVLPKIKKGREMENERKANRDIYNHPFS